MGTVSTLGGTGPFLPADGVLLLAIFPFSRPQFPLLYLENQSPGACPPGRGPVSSRRGNKALQGLADCQTPAGIQVLLGVRWGSPEGPGDAVGRQSVKRAKVSALPPSPGSFLYPPPSLQPYTHIRRIHFLMLL